MRNYGQGFSIFRKLFSFVKPLLFVLVVIEILSLCRVIPDNFFPAPHRIVRGVIELQFSGMPPGYKLYDHFVGSIVRVLAGFTTALVVSFPLGIAMGRYGKFRDYISPVIEALRPVPPLAWLPISVLWFGLGIASKSFLIFLGAFFPLLSNTMLGVSAVEKDIIEGAMTLGANGKDILFKLVIPASLPSVFTGARIGMGIGWMTLVAAELTGVKSGYGLGYMIMTARDLQRIDLVFAGMAVIGVTGLFIDLLIRLLENKVLKWKSFSALEN